MDNAISDRMSLLRFAMIFGIVFLHIPPLVSLQNIEPGIFPFFKALISHGVFKSTVPVLTCISGYLLFSKNLDISFINLVKKKTKTLLLPLFFWNFPLVVALYYIQKYNLFTHEFSANLYPFDWLNIIDKTFGIFSLPVNYPLNFLRDLYILSLLAPLFGYLLRRIPWIGFGIVFVLFWYGFDGKLILRNIMAINFYIGGMAAVLHWNLLKLDKFSLICLILFFSLCSLIVVLKLENLSCFRFVSPFLIWPMSAPIVYTKIGSLFRSLAPSSFLIFLSHGPAVLLVWFIYQWKFSNISYIIFWFSSPFIVVSVILLLKNVFSTNMWDRDKSKEEAPLDINDYP